ncbi:multidrug efflux system membrane fusion protein [Stella humosa]|uniref:Multidrug efflux system membrane fusion protein n=1 Tax=Stella humosa TaxID=94 RepID=A0A3N1KPF8_9PROT|nr:efflux RND transporter periplasmic adaptor subunit [Stella humosa]ROP83633.1 multidrug efflux system membrane fusion protein [Stella humosa]BBK33094.1 MexE family multidrug efflux RND transporter periplasmic adaptor subunit [Stella humosa]
MRYPSPRSLLLVSGVLLAVGAGSGAVLSALKDETPPAAAAPAAPPAMPASVAAVVAREIVLWNEFSGRLEAIERVDIRPRVTGSVQAVHFREGALVKKGDLLFTIDPAPYETEIQRLKAQILAAQSRLALTRREQDRGRQMIDSGMAAISQSNLDQRVSAYREAEANLRTAEAGLQAAQLNLGYTQIRAPVSGRTGKLEVTIGNLVAAGADAAVLTTIVSVDPIYAAFSADEDVVAKALAGLPEGADATLGLERIPVEMETAANEGRPIRGQLQLIDNQVDPRTGTVRMRAIFDNPTGRLMPGQFARLRMGEAASHQAILISERAVGTDQGKKFVMVLGADDKAAYREVTLGAQVDGLRQVTKGLQAGERIIVNGLHRVRPGAAIQPQMVEMAAPQR